MANFVKIDVLEVLDFAENAGVNGLILDTKVNKYGNSEALFIDLANKKLITRSCYEAHNFDMATRKNGAHYFQRFGQLETTARGLKKLMKELETFRGYEVTSAENWLQGKN